MHSSREKGGNRRTVGNSDSKLVFEESLTHSNPSGVNENSFGHFHLNSWETFPPQGELVFVSVTGDTRDSSTRSRATRFIVRVRDGSRTCRAAPSRSDSSWFSKLPALEKLGLSGWWPVLPLVMTDKINKQVTSLQVQSHMSSHRYSVTGHRSERMQERPSQPPRSIHDRTQYHCPFSGCTRAMNLEKNLILTTGRDINTERLIKLIYEPFLKKASCCHR